jgi:3-oxoacyl-[acyl-carrier protein] reductase
VDEAGMAETAKAISDSGGEVLAVRTDVSLLEQVEALASRVQEAFGPVRILCNNAGVALWGGLESVTYQD